MFDENDIKFEGYGLKFRVLRLPNFGTFNGYAGLPVEALTEDPSLLADLFETQCHGRWLDFGEHWADGNYWLGFSCMTPKDVIPLSAATSSNWPHEFSQKVDLLRGTGREYRTQDFVRSTLDRVGRQFKELRDERAKLIDTRPISAG